jgi:hypothetical protein
MDENGQITIDYLISITIFLFAVVFVFNYTSGIFTPFQSNSDEVTLIADRVSTKVVEKWISEKDEAAPNIVNKEAVSDFFNETNIKYDSTLDSLGMNGTYMRYDLNITLENDTGIINSAGKRIPSGVNVGQTKRVIKSQDHISGQSEVQIISFRVW